MNEPQNNNQLQVKVSDEVLKGTFANMLQVGHTQEEFILDFMSLFPPTGIITSRVIVTPSHIKRIVAAISDNLKKYEDQFGVIPTSDPNLMPKVGFRTE
jgi:hypothetical protein